MNTLVLGAGGFIGHHMVNRLKQAGHSVVGVGLHHPKFSTTMADTYHTLDLSVADQVKELFKQHKRFDVIYHFAADMGGAGYIFTGEHDAVILHNSMSINLNVAKYATLSNAGKLFYPSSACVYPSYCQSSPDSAALVESVAYPAWPDSEYGWEKLFGERLYLAYHRNHGLDIRIARFHTIFGPEGVYQGGREKSLAAICRKVAIADDGGKIEIWGDGEQTRSFLYITDCLDGIDALMTSDFVGPVNIGADEQISLNALVQMVLAIAGKKLTIKHVAGSLGVRGRNSDNRLMYEKTGWRPAILLKDGLASTYTWIQSMINQGNRGI